MDKVKSIFKRVWTEVKDFFVSKKTNVSSKNEVNQQNLIYILGVALILFVVIGLFLPTADNRVFREIQEDQDTSQAVSRDEVESQTPPLENSKKLKSLWNGGSNTSSGQQPTQINYNTAMVMGAKSGNSKDQLYAGFKVRLQNIDKFVASQDGTPIVARVVENAVTESRLEIPVGAIFYGEASYNSSMNKALIKFNRISFPDGRIQDIQASAVDESGQAGIAGNVKSDDMKNTAGQVITTFVSGLAAGSVSRDMFGQSTGGIKNGLLQAFSDTAKDRATRMGEKMKEAREWIEIESGVYFEAVIQQSMNLRQDLGGGYE